MPKVTEFQKEVLKAIVRILGCAKQAFEKILKGEPM